MFARGCCLSLQILELSKSYLAVSRHEIRPTKESFPPRERLALLLVSQLTRQTPWRSTIRLLIEEIGMLMLRKCIRALGLGSPKTRNIDLFIYSTILAIFMYSFEVGIGYTYI